MSCAAYGSISAGHSLNGDTDLKCFVSLYRKFEKCLSSYVLAGLGTVRMGCLIEL